MSLLAAAASCWPAFADIKAFNTAVSQGDYKAANAAAAETWPQLDKTRTDIALIAREFGFAALVAEDYAAAQTYAQAATEYDVRTGSADQLADLSSELLWLARHKSAPTKTTREGLFKAVTQRANRSGVDNITYLAVDALIAYDIKRQDWTRARAVDALAVHFMTEGGPSMLLDRRKYQIFEATAAYMDDQKFEQYEAMLVLTDILLADMAAADSDKAAKAFAPLYWNVAAWTNTFRSHLDARGYRSKLKPIDAAIQAKRKAEKWPARVKAALGPSSDDEDDICHLKLKLNPFPKYPPSAVINGYLSTIVLRVDVDAAGNSSNPKLLASAPLQEFGNVVLKAVPGLTFSPGKSWDPATCEVARKDYVIFFVFTMAR